MWWLALAMAGTLQTDPLDEANAGLTRRESAQAAWSQALDNLPTSSGTLRRLAMLDLAGAQRAARWEAVATRLDLLAAEGACRRAIRPGCLTLGARMASADVGLKLLEKRHQELVGSVPVAAPPPVPLGKPLSERVHAAHLPFCIPDDLRKAGIAVIDPAHPPAFLTENGATTAEVAKAVEEVKKLVVDWVDASERAGDMSLAQEHICVGLFDDATGANSMAMKGNWLFVGIRDLFTMYKVHGGDGLGAVEFSIGHELGHILQQKAGVSFDGPTVREAELHADCMAGYLMGISEDAGTRSPAQSYARNEVHRVGDNLVTNPGHHGTPEERRTAFDTGWAAGSLAQTSGRQGLHQTTTMLNACGLVTR